MNSKYKKIMTMKTIYVTPALVEFTNRCIVLCDSIDPSDVKVTDPFSGNNEYEW